jgi:hypothetical protein
MSAKNFPPSHHCKIEIENGNPYFDLNNDLFIDVIHRHILGYCGAASEVRIPDEIEEIAESCFESRESIHFVKFGSGSKLTSIQISAFAHCWHLKTITIPSSVTVLGRFCFGGSSLQTVSFCPGSQLASISDLAFSGCYSLESITIPCSVKTIGARCFASCPRLVISPLPLDSEVVRIESYAFAACFALTSMLIPSSVEFIGEFCFDQCSSLLTLAFSPQFHLKELLDLPLKISRVVCIPDSVEVIAFELCARFGLDETLIFGPDSRLAEIKHGCPYSLRPRAFLQVSARSLKKFRADLEFKGRC